MQRKELNGFKDKNKLFKWLKNNTFYNIDKYLKMKILSKLCLPYGITHEKRYMYLKCQLLLPYLKAYKLFE